MSIGAPNMLAAVGVPPADVPSFAPYGATGRPMFLNVSAPQMQPRVTLPPAFWGGNGDVLTAGWQPSDPYMSMGDYRIYGRPTAYIDRTGQPPMPPLPQRRPVMQAPRPQPGADDLNALVLAALANQPAQQPGAANYGADQNIRRFMGIGQ